LQLSALIHLLFLPYAILVTHNLHHIIYDFHIQNAMYFSWYHLQNYMSYKSNLLRYPFYNLFYLLLP
jgi:hypothetical protein